MKINIFLWIFISCLLIQSCDKESNGNPQPQNEAVIPEKTNPTRVYMHYMPWFHSKDFSGYWGVHWRMSNKNPENILPNGNREIAAHYYPLIGPYDSADPDLIDYHMLLIKYAGIDGILIDWYGSHNVLDYGSNLKNSNAIIEGVKRTGIDFGIVYEEFTAEEVERRTNLTDLQASSDDMEYMETNYFSSDHYIIANNNPLLLTFGPRYFKSKDQWTEILGALNNDITYLPLWGHRHRVGDANSAGEFSWVDFNTNLQELDAFYKDTGNGFIMGSAYPGFHDFYAEGGWGDSYGFVDHKDGETLQNTLDKASQYNLPYLQLVTWNDFGEGTMFEPTVEFQYQFLETIQEFTGVEMNPDDLIHIFTYYCKRKEYEDNAEVQAILDDVFTALNKLDVAKAAELLSEL